MDKTYPDKWVRKAIFDAINGITVDGDTVNVYDRRTGLNNPKSGVILQEQRNDVVKDSKCDYRWRHTILIEVFDRIPDVGNAGSRVNADNIMEAVKDGIINLTLDVGSGLSVISETLTFPGDLSIPDGTEILNRKFLRVLYMIN